MMLPHYFVIRKSSWCSSPDSRLHTQHTMQPAPLRATHLVLERTIMMSTNWTLQTRHTVDRGESGDMDTYFVCTGGVRHLYCNKTVIGYTSHKATCAFHNVVRRHYSGEVGEFTIFLCEIFQTLCMQKFPQDSLHQNFYKCFIFAELFKI